MHQDHGNDEATCLTAIQHGFTSRDDGRLAEGRRQDRRRATTTTSRSPAAWSRWRTGSAPRSRASSACSARSRHGGGEAEDGHGAEGKLSPRPAADRSRPGGRLRRAPPGSTRWRSPCGTSHGAYKFTRKPDGDILAMRVIEAIHRRLPNTHLVMHGSSSVPQALQDVVQRVRRRDAADLGRAGRGDRARHPPRRAQGQHRHRLPHGDDRRSSARSRRENRGEFDPRKFLKPAMDALRELCRERFEQFGTAGHASKIKVDAAGRDGAALRRRRARPADRRHRQGRLTSRSSQTARTRRRAMTNDRDRDAARTATSPA